MEHKYNAKQEESILPTQYLPWKEVFEQKAAEQFPGKHPWDHAIELSVRVAFVSSCFHSMSLTQVT
jgi:hypothetical protein